jgi:hypothetical protein
MTWIAGLQVRALPRATFKANPPSFRPRHPRRQAFRMAQPHEEMKTVTPPVVQEALYTFCCPKLGYDIAMIPHSERDRTRLKSEAKRKGMSLVEFARDQLLGVLISCGQIE